MRSSRSRELWWVLSGALSLVLVVAYWTAIRKPANHVLREEPVVDGDSANDGWNSGTDDSGFPGALTWKPAGTGNHLKAIYVTHRDLVKTATDLVKHYQADEPCFVREATYLDALGNTWACLVEGPGWVDLCIVRENAQRYQTKVGILRMPIPKEETSNAKGV